MTTRADIEEFLDQKRMAFVGVSRNPADFSRGLFRDLVSRGYDVVPVNPDVDEVEGKHCFASVGQVEHPVDAALIMTPPSATDAVVAECADAGIHHVWLHQGVGRGAATDTAVDYCLTHGMSVVAGFCPYMFLPETPLFHRMHGFVLKVSGRYPSRD